MEKLLTRDEFRSQVLQRGGGKCCVPTCAEKAVDAHHILNRNLFTDEDEFGGYFLSNGAQLCSSHHYDAEATKISPEQLREWCKLPLRVPNAMEEGNSYDTWGNQVLPDGRRIPGPLFHDSGFQTLLKKANLNWLFY